MSPLFSSLVFTIFFALSACTICRADEGMWLFNDLPAERLQQRYQFEPGQAWVDHLRLSSVRFNVGGSGSFVSSDGLVLTNHHVASDTLYKLSTAERNIMDDGFLAERYEDELRAPDLELNQLVAIVDVTERVQAAVPEGLDADAAAAARRAVMVAIEKESLDETGFRSDVVTLFGGAAYHLYRYKKYTDVRLVWAPETAIAFFGGDADNFEYPRYCMDATLMRVYEDGQPAKLEHFLRWRDTALTEDELVFVSGHPGRTQRMFTVDALKFLRDQRIPFVLDYLRRKEIMLQQYGLQGREQRRRGRDELFGIQNARKAYTGMLAGLQDPATIFSKQTAETELLAAVANDPSLAPLAAAWSKISEIQAQKAALLRQTTSFRSRLYEIAETLNLMAEEDAKPNEQRLREYAQAGRESLLQDLLSEAPIYDDLERAKLSDEIARLVEQRGGDDELVVEILAGKGPRPRATELIAETELADVAKRQALVDAGQSAVHASTDPMIQLARLMEPHYRQLRQQREALEEQERQAYTQITQATNAIRGTDTYPDATFTLRLAFGTVRGYHQDGQWIAPWTNLAGTYQHAESHAGQEDFDLPARWLKKRPNVDGQVQMNFVCTADIIGGNSGSPVVDREGKLVGLIFDGNIQSLTNDYVFSDQQGRAVSVAAAAIREVLRSVYQSPELADSLGR